MIILITGTPGTGKTTVSSVLKERLDAHLIAINELVLEKHLYTGVHPQKKYKIVDMEALIKELNFLTQKSNEGDVIIEGHLSHFYEKSDLVIVLRADPHLLSKRMKSKGWNDSKIDENLEAEALGICSYEAHQIHSGKANEIDTSDISPQQVSDLIIDVLNGDKNLPIGAVDYLDHLK